MTETLTAPPIDGVSETDAPGDAVVHPVLDDGIYDALAFETYLAQPRVSKSTLWTFHTRSPAHSRVEKEPSNVMAFGTAAHCAVLEPDAFTSRFKRGPNDRRGNKWKDFIAKVGEGAALTADDYDGILQLRDAIRHHPLIRQLTGEGLRREVTAFWTDPETGLQLRARPDAINERLPIMADLKSTTDARPAEFARVAGRLGYHLQEAIYSEGWRVANGLDAPLAFVFIALERTPPYAFRIFEMDPDAAAEGHAIMRKALDQYARCKARNEWPGYPHEVEPLSLRKWDFSETQPGEA